jgi:DNA polymerase-3 subunit delta'
VAFSSETALELLRRAYKQNRLAHAYLFSGPPGSGKRELAAGLTATVANVDAGNVFGSGAAEVHVAEPESKSRRIVVDQIRALEHALQMRSATGGRKVAIISDADRLQSQAANAFLKTLEEPPNDSLLLLLTTMPEALPDTILSRCITLQLAPRAEQLQSAEEQELLGLLDTVRPEKSSGIQMPYRLAQGFQRLLASVRQVIQEENAAALKRDELRYKNTTDGAWLDSREEHYKALSESLYLRKRAQLVETIFLWWSDVLRASTNIATSELPASRAQTAAIAARLSTQEILRRLRAVEDLRDNLGRNIQEALAVEVAFLRVFRF